MIKSAQIPRDQSVFRNKIMQ